MDIREMQRRNSNKGGRRLGYKLQTPEDRSGRGDNFSSDCMISMQLAAGLPFIAIANATVPGFARQCSALFVGWKHARGPLKAIGTSLAKIASRRGFGSLKIRRIGMSILRVVMAGLAVLLVSLGPTKAELMKARLAQNLSPISGITIIAKAEGFFEKHGLDIEVSNFTTGKQCLDTLIGGGADIATTAEAPVTAAAMSGQPIAFVAGMEYSDLKTLVSVKAGLKTKADLKGKKIAFTAGTGSEVYTSALLKAAGLSASDVTLVNLRPQEMLAALAAGSIDAFDTWEPNVANAKKALGAEVAELDTKGIYSETFNIVVMQAGLSSNPALTEKFLASIIEAETWMKAHPEEAMAIVAKVVGLKEEDLSPIWNDYVYHVAIGPKQLDALEAHSSWRLESGNHPPGAAMPDFSKVIFPDSLRKLDASRVTYKQ
ncbi:NrtA/SsuA/CpmA family ABC transporter substrate-binding protein [Bradyrhizobium sp. dw_78]|uniref:ABC transporter substrate-binding protein n=1 Tax=Bradyrhizobium sp. dw_78 TaxID=2719793 RepID=UPI003209DBA6